MSLFVLIHLPYQLVARQSDDYLKFKLKGKDKKGKYQCHNIKSIYISINESLCESKKGEAVLILLIQNNVMLKVLNCEAMIRIKLIR